MGLYSAKNILWCVFVSMVLHSLLFAWPYFRNTEEIHAMAGGRQIMRVTLVTESSQDARMHTNLEPRLLSTVLASNAALPRPQQESFSAAKRVTNVVHALIAKASQVKSDRVEAISSPHMLAQNTSPTAIASPPESSTPPAQVNDSRIVKQVYLAQLRAAIAHHKYYPRRARRLRKEGNVRLEFFIYRDGRIDNVTIRESSGEPLLDRAARQSVLKLGIYQPFPDRLEASFLSVAVAMRYVIDI